MERIVSISGLGSRLPVRGHIKIGRKGQARKNDRGVEYQIPEKVDHFIITTLERDENHNFKRDPALHKLYGDKPTELPVQLIYNDLDLNFQDHLAAYKGKTRWCYGNREHAFRLNDNGDWDEVGCPCPRLESDYDKPDKCKPHGRLDVVIDGATSVGGVYRFDTTSWNSCEGLKSSLRFIRDATGGRLAGIPLLLRLSKQTATNPVTQKPVDIFVVSIEYRGTMADLQEGMLRRLEADRSYFVRMAQLESRVRAEAPDEPFTDEEQTDTAEEFHPEAGTPPKTGDAGTENGAGTGETGTKRRRKTSSEENTPTTRQAQVNHQQISKNSPQTVNKCLNRRCLS